MLKETRSEEKPGFRESVQAGVRGFLTDITTHEIPQSNLRLRFGKDLDGGDDSVARVVVESKDYENDQTGETYSPQAILDISPKKGEKASFQVHSRSWKTSGDYFMTCTELGQRRKWNYDSAGSFPLDQANSLPGNLKELLETASTYFPEAGVPKPTIGVILSVYAFSLADSLGLVEEDFLTRTINS